MIGVGLEIGGNGNSLKLAIVEGVRGSFRLLDFEVHKVDAKKGDVEDDIVSVLDEALRRLKVPRQRVVTSVRAQDCMIREITVPFVEEDKLRKTIKYQAENYFTSMSIDDLIIEYSKFAEVDGKSKLMVAGIKKSLIDRRLQFLGECGVDPLAIDLDVAALFNAYAELGVFEGKGAVLVVEIEQDTLKVGVVEDGKLRLARAIRMQVGSMRIDAAARRPKAQDDSGVHDTAADESARLPVVILDEGEDEAFSLEDSGISEIEREGIIHRVFMEIDRTVAAVALGKEIELICLTGASCALDGIEPMFSEHFEITATRVDVSEKLGAGPDKKQKGETSASLEGVSAIGLALKALGVDHARMDFRQEEFAYRGAFAQLKRGLACTLTLLFALVFLYAFSLKQELREKKNAFVAAKSLQKNLYTVLFPSIDDLGQDHQPLLSGPAEDEKYFESLQQQQARLRTKFSGAADNGAARYSALEVLRRFAQGKSEVAKEWGIEVLRVRIDPRDSGKSTIDCAAVDQGAAIELARRFEPRCRGCGKTVSAAPGKPCESCNGTDIDVPIITAKAQSSQHDPKTGRWLFSMLVEIRPPADARSK